MTKTKIKKEETLNKIKKIIKDMKQTCYGISGLQILNELNDIIENKLE